MTENILTITLRQCDQKLYIKKQGRSFWTWKGKPMQTDLSLHFLHRPLGAAVVVPIVFKQTVVVLI